ncbi:trypsinogen-like protein 3 isoform X1 [Acanthopagrus latus]|uniref:trypsinogen-like protein 3 isoform X1 n=1 Tax=Acanthopagrus latus TaxID=8177 RepID=UPI00187C83AB|nr:trypsinogen-like protein 3 isoform X1 [Acanthopagrus latus]
MNLLLLVIALGLAGVAAGASPLGDYKVCQPHSRPWQVRLHGGGVACSGALINEWWIVTSFECAPSRPYSTIASLGEHDITLEEGTEQHIDVADVIRHGPYRSSRSPIHSLTMVRLASPARFNQFVQPIPLASRCAQPGENCSVSGWGSTIPNHYEPDQRLKCINVPIVDDQTCMNTFPVDLFWSPYMICAGQANTDNCLGDRGSVMVCDGQLQGVQWFAHGCSDPAHPSIHSKLCLYNNWIKSVMDTYRPPLDTTPGAMTM